MPNKASQQGGKEPHHTITDEGTYHSMMVRPVSGHDNQRKSFGRFLKGWTETEWEIINIPSRGEIIIAEGIRNNRIQMRTRPPTEAASALT